MAFSIKQQVAQQIVEAIKDVCAHDINFMDSNGIIFASTNQARIGDFHKIALQVVKTGETIEVESDDDFHGTKKGVNIPFIYKGDINAVIGISGEPSEVRSYAYLAQKFTTLLLREHELDTQGQNQKTQLHQIIRAIISHDYINPDFLTSFFKKYQTSLDVSYQTVLVRLNTRYNPSNLSMIEQHIFHAFDMTGSALYSFNYPNEYILFIESSKLRQVYYQFEQLASNNAPILKIGIGHAAPLSQQHKSYHSAKIAADSLFLNHYIAEFDSLDLEIVLADVSKESQQYFLSKTMSALTEKELELLRVYFSLDMSLKDTCEALYLHKNTLQYRLDKIFKTTGYNPRSFQDAAVLYIGLKLISQST